MPCRSPYAGRARGGDIQQPPLTLERVLGEVIGTHAAEKGNVQRLSAAEATLRIVAAAGFSTPFLEHFRAVGVDGSSVCARVLRGRCTVFVRDVERDAEFAPHREVARAEGFRGVVSVPIAGRGLELAGVLSLHFGRPRSFGELEMHQLEREALRLAPLLERPELATRCLRVLVVADDRDVALVISDALTDAGQRIEVALDRDAALMLTAHHAPDVVVVDTAASRYDAFALVREMRSHHPMGVVAVTEHLASAAAAHDRAARLGITLRKPFELDDLYAAVLRAVPTD